MGIKILEDSRKVAFIPKSVLTAFPLLKFLRHLPSRLFKVHLIGKRYWLLIDKKNTITKVNIIAQ